jgi:alpha-galactosidase
VLGTLPKVKELGLKWVDIDDGYQQAEGDWDVVRDKFPGGDADMRKLVDKIHSMGLKAKLWWAPLAVDPESKLLTENPDIILETSDGAPQYITWWNSYYMSPVYKKTIDHTQGVLRMFLKDWDFDGLKMDGQHLNCVPPDYGNHNLNDPMESFEKLPEFFKMIYETAHTYKPNAVLQICPCGDAMSFFNMPWTNQTVASDPTSSWQIRLKGKTYKALLGNRAYYADHVELSDGGDDFGTQIGIGGVLGTKFTWPKDNPYVTEGHFVLTPEKEKIWKKWISIYNQKMLPTGTYLGSLYDIGYDKPETHVILKNDTVYYAFYNPDWNGEIELRGLGAGKYRITDYVNNRELGIVDSSNPKINVQFKRNLLLEAVKTE